METEAYCGNSDKACHAWPNKRTSRTEVMFGTGGHAYIYLCYGIHHLFNIVTGPAEQADAVLIRALEPMQGIELMEERRNQSIITNLCSGPGKLSEAMGLKTDLNNTDLLGDRIWLEDRGYNFDIVSSTRIGVDYAGDDAALEWRFFPKDSKWVSVV